MGGDFGLTRMTMAVIRAHQRNQEHQHKHALKMQALELAEGEVEEQNRYVQTITSFHKECSPNINWNILTSRRPPIMPVRTNDEEVIARSRREKYIPGFWTKLLNLTQYMINKLETNIERARNADELRHAKATGQFKSQYEKWQKETELAKNILNGNPESYKSVIRDLKLWSEIEEIGKTLNIDFHDDKNMEISLKDNRACVPQQRKRALKRGGVSLTNMPMGLYNEICYSHICSSAIRVIREVFAALPVESIQINIIGDFVNTITGHPEKHPILSVKIPRDSLKDVNWDNINPTNFIKAFAYRVNFKKTKGFNAITKL